MALPLVMMGNLACDSMFELITKWLPLECFCERFDSMNDRLSLNCPGCNAKLAVDSKHAGKKLKCPRCQTLVPVFSRIVDRGHDGDNLSFLVDDDPPPIRMAQPLKNELPTSKEDDDVVRCPECDSRQVHAEKRGWSFWLGFLGSGRIVITCLKCGHRFYPGDG